MVTLSRIRTGDVELNVAVQGEGPAVVLLHGFPHTWRVWEPVVPALARTRTVIAPDLRGLGDSSRPEKNYTAGDVAGDVIGLLDEFGIGQAALVGIDLGTPAAFLAALRHPRRISRLVLAESLVGTLPGAERFTPPWWFGFHAVPGLAETVLAGHEAEYLDFFLRAGTLGDGAGAGFTAAVHEAYSAPGALRAAFEHYRAFPESARQIDEAVAGARLRVPTLCVGAFPVGEATFRQVRPVADDVRGTVLDGCGHIVPQHRPQALLGVLEEFLT
ncbi:alpha/beta hydrolase [Kineosporia sp. J2-2]|uniref:Alpha/beta hydrolase n=1 Tax=Kineosporia corallincola TaxID=2835133 RepID=A0ABS5TG65_9ACTN|nr:alpha/beta hydrolase [Kineosporia corallincola]MBT0770061.1 alpha/beta hydrolase [Kineosporia corallincola]